MESGISFAQLNFDYDDRFLRLRHELGVATFGFNQIVLQPGQRGRIHRHERQEEVLVVLEGTLDLVAEGETHEVPQGGLARVAPAVRRQLVNRGPGRLALLAIGGAQPHDGRDGVAFASWDDGEGVPPVDLPNPDDLPADLLRS